MNLQDHKSCLALGCHAPAPLQPPLWPLATWVEAHFISLIAWASGHTRTNGVMKGEGINFHLTRYILCKHLNQQRQQQQQEKKLQQQAWQLLYQLAACIIFFFFCFSLFYSFFCLLLTFSLHVYGFSSHTPALCVCVCVCIIVCLCFFFFFCASFSHISAKNFGLRCLCCLPREKFKWIMPNCCLIPLSIRPGT